MSAAEAALWAAVCRLPVAAGATLCLAGRRTDRVAAPVALAVAAALVALAAVVAWQRPAVAVPFVAGGGSAWPWTPCPRWSWWPWRS